MGEWREEERGRGGEEKGCKTVEKRNKETHSHVPVEQLTGRAR